MSEVRAADSPRQLVIQASKRRELLEVLDRVIAYEHYYRSVYGHFTKILSRIGYSIPASITDVYEIRAVEASADRLLLTALSEIDGRTVDLVSVDHDFRVHANFPLPAPRPIYLRAHALKHLRSLRDAPQGQKPHETGIFQGYFRFEIRKDASDRGTGFAIGTRAPVVGVQLELSAGDTGGDDGPAVAAHLTEEDLAAEVPSTGQRATGNLMSTLEEAYLAQRIFRGEVGRYARDWSELTRIASFRFKDRDQIEGPAVPFGDSSESGLEVDMAGQAEKPMTVSAEEPQGLVIEAISEKEAPRGPASPPRPQSLKR